MKYAMNLAADGRILSATYPKFAPENAPTVDQLPEGNLHEYLYIGGQFVHDPLPKAGISSEAETSKDITPEDIAAAILEGMQAALSKKKTGLDTFRRYGELLASDIQNQVALLSNVEDESR